ncbi:MAG: CotH kinase family protein [Prevotella sp.]|nr:CotH kinase family protein [Prevotella sp.]
MHTMFTAIFFVVAALCMPTYALGQTSDGLFSQSTLPIVVVSTTEAINANEKVMATLKIIDNGAGNINHLDDPANDYDGYCGIKWRGNSSLSFPQKKYTVETWDAEGNDVKASLLGMPEESDWVLLAPYNDVSMVRDVYAFALWNEMGHWGPRTRMVEVVVNNEYMGVYALCERIKRDKNRVDVSKLKTTDVEGRDVTGGYILRVDAFDDTDATFTSKVQGVGTAWGDKTITWTVYYPKKEDLQQQQMDYISQYVGDVETTIAAITPDDETLEEPRKLIDLDSFVDYFIHTELTLNADGFKRSSYFNKAKQQKDGTGGLLAAGPVWDFNLAFGNCNFCNADNVEAWVYQGCETNPTPAMWRTLIGNTCFRQAVSERYTELRQSVLTSEAFGNFLDAYAEELGEAKDRHLKKYPELLSSSPSQGGQGDGWGWPGWGWTWPGWGGQPGNIWFAAYQVSSYDEEISTMKEWFAQRLAFLDQSFLLDQPVTASIADALQIEVQASPFAVKSNKALRRVAVYTLAGTPVEVNDHLPRGTYIVSCEAEDGSTLARIVRRN